MLSRLTQFAKKQWLHLSTVANQLFRRMTEPAQSNPMTGTLAELPRSRTGLLADVDVSDCASTGLSCTASLQSHA